MPTFILRRLLTAIPTLWFVASLTFLALALAPGDPIEAALTQGLATAEQIAARRAALGLDRSPLEQYLRYLASVARGDLGTSLFTGQPVSESLLTALPATVSLALGGMLFAIVLGLGLGVASAARPSSHLGAMASSIAGLSVSTPVALTGVLGILSFSVWLGWLPAGGSGGLRHLLLPAGVLGFAACGAIARVARASLLTVRREPFVVAARGRGVGGARLLFRHTLRPALAPIAAIVALQTGFLLGGAVVTETVFARPGLGRLLVDAILRKDLPVVQGVVLASAAAYIVCNLAADLVAGWVDPRIGLGSRTR